MGVVTGEQGWVNGRGIHYSNDIADYPLTRSHRRAGALMQMLTENRQVISILKPQPFPSR